MCVELEAVVVSVDREAHVAVVDDGRGLHRVSLALLALEGVSVDAGDRVAVHTGLAVRRVDPAAAAEASRSAT